MMTNMREQPQGEALGRRHHRLGIAAIIGDAGRPDGTADRFDLVVRLL